MPIETATHAELAKTTEVLFETIRLGTADIPPQPDRRIDDVRSRVRFSNFGRVMLFPCADGIVTTHAGRARLASDLHAFMVPADSTLAPRYTSDSFNEDWQVGSRAPIDLVGVDAIASNERALAQLEHVVDTVLDAQAAGFRSSTTAFLAMVR